MSWEIFILTTPAFGTIRRPTGQSLGTFDTILIDLQDLGCRIYTFITTLLYVLEAASELGVIGAMLVVGIVVAGGARIFRGWRHAGHPVDRTQIALAASLFAAALMNALISSDFAGNNELWLTIGLGIGITIHARADETVAEPLPTPVDSGWRGLSGLEP